MSLFHKTPPDRDSRCFMCGKWREHVKKLVVGLHGAICLDCLHLVDDIFQHEGSKEAFKTLRGRVCLANQALFNSGLVTMHSGNASGLDPDQEIVYIKPSGMDYQSMTPESMVAIDLKTGESKGKLKPSVDLPHHLFLYRNMPEIRGIVHTHSNYATAFAACGLPIPPILTAIADEFSGEIPCAPYVDNEGSNIGEAILKYKNNRAPAILLKNHGVFTWGQTPEAALKAAVMVEDVAKTVWLSRQLGNPEPLAKEEIETWWDRYQNRYGQ